MARVSKRRWQGEAADPEPAPRSGPSGPARAAHLGIVERLALLRHAFDERDRRDDQDAAAPQPHMDRPLRTRVRPVLKTVLGLVLVVAAGVLPVRALLETTSTEAVVNARLVTLRAPVEGTVEPLLAGWTIGSELGAGAAVLRIVNSRADRSRLDDLRRAGDRFAAEAEALVAKRNDLEALLADLRAQIAAFRDGRQRQLRARAAELKSEIAAAEASREEADGVLARAAELFAKGSGTKAAHDKALRDAAVATHTDAALQHRLAGVEVELAALEQGTFVGDSYNDQPRSAQRADEVAQRLSEVTADLHEREAQLASVRRELASERARYLNVASAQLVAPVRARVWEVLTAPGESVVRGQELLRLLDCSGVLVTASVGERTYNRLRVGDPASFRFREDGTDHRGRIVSLTGVAAVSANLAIQPAALAKEPYRATVELPGLANSGAQCDVGRTGRVTFHK
jgi:multidrug resistance efflux pump